MNKYILVIESSTTSAKVLLLNIDSSERQVFTEKFSKDSSNNGIQDADGVFSETINLVRRVCEGKEISIIVLSGTWHSLLICDNDMRPITKTYTWASTFKDQVSKYVDTNHFNEDSYYLKTGCMNSSIYPFFKLLHLKNNGFDFKNKYICGQGSYTNYRLTNRFHVSDSMASGTGLLDIKQQIYANDLLKLLEINENQLPKIVNFKETSPLSKEGGKLLGLKEGIPVITACPDGGLNQGATSSKPGVMSFSVGTSAAIRLNAEEPTFIEKSGIWSYLSPEGNIIGAATSGACNCTDWFKDTFLNMSYSEINKKMIEVQDTPIFLPFLFGERSPGWNSDKLGLFAKIKPEHTPLHFYKSVEEGILFNVYQCFTEIESRYKGTINEIYLSGGILNSKNWTQMCADIFNRELLISTEKESSLWGGAILGIKKLNLENKIQCHHNSLSVAVMPDKNKNVYYQKKYQEYLSCYQT